MDETLLSEREAEAYRKTHEMSYEQAAKEMGITKNTLKGHLERISEKRKKARATLGIVGGPKLDTFASGADIGIGKETTYRQLRIISLPGVDCSADYVVVDKYTRDPVRSFNSDDFGSEAKLRAWLDDCHEDYWGE